METHLHMVEPDNAGPHTKTTASVPVEAYTDEAFAKLVGKTLVCIAHRFGEGIHPGVSNNFGIWGRIGLQYATLADPHGGFVEIVRGHMERVFLDQCEKNPNLEYLVMIDNDESISWDAPLRLVANEKDVCTGIVCGFNAERGIFACITAADDKGVPRFPSFRFTKQFPGKGLKQIHQCGTGLVAIHRRVLETLIDRGEMAFMIDDRLRKESYRIGHIKQGEDFSFCDRVRAAGFTIWADFSVKALHYKIVALGWPEELVDDDLDASEWSVSNLDFRGLKHLEK